MISIRLGPAPVWEGGGRRPHAKAVSLLVSMDGVITEDELREAVIRLPTPPRATPPRVLSESPSRAAAVSGGSRRKSANAADLDHVARI